MKLCNVLHIEVTVLSNASARVQITMCALNLRTQ